MIDWNGKLEAVHTDGRVMPILSVKGPDFEGDYAVSPAPDGRDCFRADGSKWIGEITGYDTGWTIRNTPVSTPTPDERAVAPELVERMRAFVQKCHNLTNYNNPNPSMPFVGLAVTEDERFLCAEARAIVAALEPVDPDVEIARDLSASLIERHSPVMAANIRAGDGDHYAPFVHVLAAIKRGRQLQRDSVTGVTLGTREQFESECG